MRSNIITSNNQVAVVVGRDGEGTDKIKLLTRFFV